MVDLSVDLANTYWTVAEAAEAAQVDANVVRNWKYRKLLVPARTNWRGQPEFLALDVIRVEGATRARARRSYAAA